MNAILKDICKDYVMLSSPSKAEARNGYLPCEYKDGNRIYPATEQNQQYQASEANYVTMQELYDEHFADKADIVARAKKSFLDSHPVLAMLERLEICKIKMIKGKDLRVDKTLQRKLKPAWVLKILAEFNANAVSAIQVWETEEFPGKYGVYDAQHTLIMLKIALEALGVDTSDYEFPCVVSPTKIRPDLREVFIGHNGGAYKNVIDQVEMHRQLVHKVRSDKRTGHEERDSESRQSILEKYNMFLALPKSPESKLGGACGNVSEILDKGYNLKMLEAFCRFYSLSCDSQRPVESKEPWMIMNYFKLCYQSGINYSDPEYIKEMVRVLSNNKDQIWNPDKLYKHATEKYKDKWKALNPKANFKKEFKLSLGRSSDGRKFVTQAMLVAQLANYMDKQFTVPVYTFDNWHIDTDDLYPVKTK
jgi:hypothetical protein